LIETENNERPRTKKYFFIKLALMKIKYIQILMTFTLFMSMSCERGKKNDRDNILITDEISTKRKNDILLVDKIEADDESQKETDLIKNRHQIDISLDTCLNGPYSSNTMGITNCLEVAYKNWQNRMDSISNRLIQISSPEIVNSFKTSQEKWEGYFKSQINFSNKLFENSEGTMYISLAVKNIVTILKRRVLLLEAHLREAEFQELGSDDESLQSFFDVFK